jgi:hypothetical protein
MIRLATMDELNGEGARLVPLQAATYVNTPLSSAPKAMWVGILGLAASLLLFAPRAWSKEGLDSYRVVPSFPPSPFTTDLLEPQSTLNAPQEDAQQ